MSDIQIQDRFRRFKSGRSSVESELCSCRPVTAKTPLNVEPGRFRVLYEYAGKNQTVN